MFSFLSSLIESRDKWLQQKNTIVNTAPYLNPDLNVKLISNTAIKIDPIFNSK
jgi:hypothetical protein